MSDQLSKKQKRELAKEHKKQERERNLTFLKIRKFAIWLVSGGIVIFLGFRAWNWISQPTPEVAGVTTEVKDTDWVKGKREAAQAILIEYGDFQCEACANYYPLVKRLNQDFPDNLTIIYRHFPLTSIHPNAIDSAKAAEAAGIQGKFWEMHDKLYEKQKEWENEGNPKEKFVSLAKEIGLEEEKFRQDLESETVKNAVEEDNKGALSLGINSTPTFFLNGKKIQPRGYEEFKSLVEAQIKGYTIE